MHVNALKRKEELELNEKEIFETKSSLLAFIALVAVACTSMLVVIVFGGRYSGYSGFVYMTIPIILPLLKKSRVKKMKKLFEPIQTEEETDIT